MAQKKPLAPPPFDYSALYASDPILQASLAHVNTLGTQARGDLTAARNDELVKYGAIPGGLNKSLAGQIAPDITDSTRQLADQNTQAGLSTTARIAKAYHERQQGDNASLAARGILHSGAYRQHALEDLSGYQGAQAGAAEDLTSKLANLWHSYTGQQEDLAGQAQTATGDATSRITSALASGQFAAPTYTTPAPQPSTYEPHTTAANFGGGQPKRRVASALSKPLL